MARIVESKLYFDEKVKVKGVKTILTGGPPGFHPKGRQAPGAEGECFAPYK